MDIVAALLFFGLFRIVSNYLAFAFGYYFVDFVTVVVIDSLLPFFFFLHAILVGL